MRISPPITILSIVAASLVVTAIEQRKAVVDNSCAVLLDFLKYETKDLGSEFLVQDEPQQVNNNEAIDAALTWHPEFRKHPDVPIYRQIAELKQFRPTETCPELATWLSSKGVKVNSSEAKSALNALGPNNFPRPIFGLSMPGMNSERNVAIIQFLYVANGNLGGQFEARLSRSPKGSWTYSKDAIGGVP